MAVSIKYTSEASAQLVVSVTPADYQPLVEKALKNARQRVAMPGFRQGKAPMGLIEKKYGLGIKIEEINQFVGSSIDEFLRNEKIEYLGQLMPASTDATDFEKATDFEFTFDLALRPKVDIQLSKEDKVDYYRIVADDKMISDHIQNMLNTYGSQISVETVEARDIVRGRLAQNGGELVKEDAIFMPEYFKSEEEKSKFVGVGINTVVEFSPYVAYAGNPAELASFIGIDKEEVEAYKDVTFSFEIQNISRHVPAELNEEFFTKVFGEEGDIKTEEQLRDQIRSSFNEQFVAESDYRLLRDARNLLLERAGKVTYAEDILKRWLTQQNKEAKEGQVSQEELDKQFPSMLEDLTLQLAKDSILLANNVEINEEDLLAFATIAAKNQFAQYGMSAVPDEVLHNYAKSMIDKKNSRDAIVARVVDNKLAEIIKREVTLVEQEVSPEQFSELISKSVDAE